ncbi:Soluble lytic murein transglycosylase [invertebrate metagenome]|uniref:Soluble lytic murein transglycosylase n=1 Tax=invertebrate metagenome TaxID=1711999 RepID=A0A2H9T8B5_9ZZZZ
MIPLIDKTIKKIRLGLASKKAFMPVLLMCSCYLPADQGQSDNPAYKPLRPVFLSVEKALQKGDNTLFEQKKSHLKAYPLYPYLEALSLKNRFFHISQRDIDRFVKQHGKGLPTRQLQNEWLNFLLQQKQWRAYKMAYHKNPVPTPKFECSLGVAYLNTQHPKLAWKKAEKLWLTGSSQHKSCNSLFIAWKKAGKLTQPLAEQRFWLAIDDSNITFARYLSKNITNTPGQKRIEQFWKARDIPWHLAKSGSAEALGSALESTTQYVVKRLVRLNAQEGASLWLALRKTLPLNKTQKDKIDHWLALRLARNLRINYDKTLAQLDPHYQFSDVTQWRIRQALSRQDWPRVNRLIPQLPDKDQQHPRWQYWRAIAIASNPSAIRKTRVHQNIKDQTSDTLLKSLSQERDFYGFLAAEIRDQDVKLNAARTSVNPKDVRRLIRQFDAFDRIPEWLALGRYYEAQSELNRLRPQLSEKQRPLVAWLAKQWGWHFQSIVTAAQESLWDDLTLRFPLPKIDYFQTIAQENKLDTSWPLAITRQESAFHPKARSHKGARGLMQLMPATARMTARLNHIKYNSSRDLYNPAINIVLGTAHLADLKERFDNNRIYATAAYNAGSSRVRRWVKARGNLPLDIWIETIPFDETRQYVQNVLTYRAIYNRLNQQPGNMLSDEETSMLALVSPAENQVSMASPETSFEIP